MPKQPFFPDFHEPAPAPSLPETAPASPERFYCTRCQETHDTKQECPFLFEGEPDKFRRKH